ncbi:MAG: ABC transporter permease [Spirochaetales bacterium]|nr:ABC transporter permease [Spirochaetales bacterium]
MSPFSGALDLIFGGDPETWSIAATTLGFSAWSTLFAALPGTAFGFALALGRFPFRRALVSVVGALTALPTVVIGLAVYSLISRSGPLGDLGWLFEPEGVILGQAVLALPVVTYAAYAGLSKLDPRFGETLRTLGAGPWRRLAATACEARLVLAGAAVSAFGRVTGEVGVSMMLGGNIRFHTRTMTTAIALDASKGEFERALSLGILLLAIALAVNAAVHALVRRDA